MDLNKATLLIADDEADLLEILRRWFEREGARVFTAGNGLAALQVLASNRVDLVVSDVRMPVMDGIELATRINAMDEPPRIVFVTGFADIDKRGSSDLGVAAILPKPVKRQDILDAVRRMLADA